MTTLTLAERSCGGLLLLGTYSVASCPVSASADATWPKYRMCDPMFKGNSTTCRTENEMNFVVCHGLYYIYIETTRAREPGLMAWNEWCFRPRFCTVRLYWGGDILFEWDQFCYESCPWVNGMNVGMNTLAQSRSPRCRLELDLQPIELLLC